MGNGNDMCISFNIIQVLIYFQLKRRSLYSILCQLQHQVHFGWNKSHCISVHSLEYFNEEKEKGVISIKFNYSVGGYEKSTVFIFICFEGNHLLQWQFRFARRNLSQWGGLGHISPWRFLSLSSETRLISLSDLRIPWQDPQSFSWHIVAISSIPRMKRKNLSPSEHPGKLWKCSSSSVSPLKCSLPVYSVYSRLKRHRNYIMWCKKAGQWALSLVC